MKRLLYLRGAIALAAFVAACACIFPARTAGAQMFDYHVTLDASALTTSDAGPFTLEFQLTSGIVPDANRTQAMLTNFAFGGGAADGSPTLTGGTSGSLNQGVVLQTSSFLNDFQQGFIPQGALEFDLCLTTATSDPARDPADGFSFAILDNTGTEIPTLGFFDIFSDVLISVDLIGSGTPDVLTYATDDSQPPAGGTTPIIMSAPTITGAAPCVPEPGSLTLLLGGGIFGILFALRRRKA